MSDAANKYDRKDPLERGGDAEHPLIVLAVTPGWLFCKADLSAFEKDKPHRIPRAGPGVRRMRCLKICERDGRTDRPSLLPVSATEAVKFMTWKKE